MKKNLLLTLLVLFVGYSVKPQSKKVSAALPVVNASIYGPANVCPGDQNVAYNTGTNFSGLNYWVEFTCGGDGVIAESGSQSYIIYNTGNNNTCHVNWGNSNGVTSWVQVTYHWTVLFVNYSASAVQYTDLGVFPPNAISGPSSICANDLSTVYNLTCPNGLPANSYGYNWSLTNAIIVGGGGISNSVSFKAANSNPIVATVRFASSCGVYSSPYSYTIQRTPSLPLGAGYILQHLESMNSSNALLVDLIFPAKPYSYNYHCIVTNPSSTPINYYGTVPANSAGGIQVALQAVGSTLYVNANLGTESCGNYWNYSRGKGGILIIGTHNRTGIWSNEEITDSKQSNFLTYPNPANEFVKFSYMSEEEETVLVFVTDVTGKVVYEREENILKGEQEVIIKVADLTPGIYFLNCKGKAFSQREKIIISR